MTQIDPTPIIVLLWACAIVMILNLATLLSFWLWVALNFGRRVERPYYTPGTELVRWHR